jgi:hypothetical protein
MGSSIDFSDCDLQVVDKPESLDGYRDGLKRLERMSPPETAYLSADFLLPWLRYAAGVTGLHTLALVKDETLLALLPLVSDKVKRGPLTIPRLGFPTQGGGHPPSFDIRCAERGAPAAAEALLATFANGSPRWKVLSLRHLSGNSALMSILPGMCRKMGLVFSWYPSRRESYLVLNGSWDSYFERVGRKIRAQVKRGLTRVEADGGWEFVHEWPAAEDVQGALERYVRLMRASWKSAEADDAGFVSLLGDVMRSFAESGNLLMSWFAGPGVDGAGIIQLRCGGVLSSFHVAHMEDCPIPGPGTLLKRSALENAYELGIQIYDFSTYAEHIHRWLPNYRNTANVYITRKNPTGRLIQHQMKKRESRLPVSEAKE